MVHDRDRGSDYSRCRGRKRGGYAGNTRTAYNGNKGSNNNKCYRGRRKGSDTRKRSFGELLLR